MHGFIKSVISSNVPTQAKVHSATISHLPIIILFISTLVHLILVTTDCCQSTVADLQSWTKLDGTPCHVAEKRLLLPPLSLFNVTVMLSLSRTLTYMLT